MNDVRGIADQRATTGHKALGSESTQRKVQALAEQAQLAQHTTGRAGQGVTEGAGIQRQQTLRFVVDSTPH